MYFERYKDPKESLRVGVKHRYMKINYLELGIGVKHEDDDYIKEEIDDVYLKSPYDVHLKLVLGLLASSYIDLKELLQYVRIDARMSRRKLKRAMKARKNLSLLIGTGADCDEIERIREVYDPAPYVIEGFRYEDGIYPLAKMPLNLEYVEENHFVSGHPLAIFHRLPLLFSGPLSKRSPRRLGVPSAKRRPLRSLRIQI